MAIIQSDEKVFMVSNGTNTTYSGSTSLKAMQQWYTMQDVLDTVGSGSAGAQVTKVLKTTVTSAQVLQLFTTPITILNSSNPLTVAYPINVYIKRKVGDSYTLVNNSFSVINDFGTIIAGLNPNPLANTEGYFQSSISWSQNLSGSGADKNVLYKLKANTGNPTLGTGDLDVYVTYIEITL